MLSPAMKRTSPGLSANGSNAHSARTGYREQALTARQQIMEEDPSLDRRITQMLTEARDVLSGVQALLGFQLVSVITQFFEKLPESSKLVYAVSLGCVTVAVILLMAPAACHRIVFSGRDTEEMHRVGSWFVTCATIPRALWARRRCLCRPDRSHRFRENRRRYHRFGPRVPRRSLARPSSCYQAARHLRATLEDGLTTFSSGLCRADPVGDLRSAPAERPRRTHGARFRR
jgi:Family of unknown function (DUF6328)